MRAIIFFSSFVILLSSCSPRLPDKKVFDKVDLSMTIEEVKNIFGEPADIRSGINSSVLYFNCIPEDVWTTDYASIYFDKNGGVSFTLYRNPD